MLISFFFSGLYYDWKIQFFLYHCHSHFLLLRSFNFFELSHCIGDLFKKLHYWLSLFFYYATAIRDSLNFCKAVLSVSEWPIRGLMHQLRKKEVRGFLLFLQHASLALFPQCCQIRHLDRSESLISTVTRCHLLRKENLIRLHPPLAKVDSWPEHSGCNLLDVTPDLAHFRLEAHSYSSSIIIVLLQIRSDFLVMHLRITFS